MNINMNKGERGVLGEGGGGMKKETAKNNSRCRDLGTKSRALQKFVIPGRILFKIQELKARSQNMIFVL